MAKIFASKPLPGLLTNRILAGKLPFERAKILSEVVKPVPYDYQGITIEIQSHRFLGDGRLEVIAKANKAGVSISVDNPLYYVNPPCCVSDGTWRNETIDGKTVELENFKEDPEAALKEIVGQTIALQVK